MDQTQVLQLRNVFSAYRTFYVNITIQKHSTLKFLYTTITLSAVNAVN